MFSTHFRRFWMLCVVVGLLTAVIGLAVAQDTPPPDEDRPSRMNIEDIPHYPLAETPEAQYQIESASVVPGSRVTFQSYRDDNWNIYVGNDDGTGQVSVTNHEMPEIHPHLNRGNSAIVYASGADEHDYEVYRMNADGNNKVALTNNEADDGNPQWSPDGTRIVFESYRDGQAEIYVMNANGSGQVRLTNHSAFDGMPSWSPDGSKIAFSSNRTGAYRIWMMNADGTSPVQLSTQPYSFRPQWSPDGTRIAYDADGDNDGWQELWLMNANGSDQQVEFDANYINSDFLVSSWSPDGRYIAITRIHFIYYQGNWYWDHAYQEARDINLYNYDTTTFRLGQNDRDWYPRWQTNDGQPPLSQVHALGTQSPGPFSVSWSGTDAGGSGGISSYDIQVKTESNGTWTNWLAGTTTTSGQYPGIGGNTYYFRVRARDRHYNFENWPATHDAVTTVEALAPQSHVNVLPPFSRQGGDIIASWSGHDPGGSGIATYDVQYRVNSSAWVNWQTATTATTAILPGGNSGETYTFRVRATDRAHNVANWPAGSGDTSTTFYAWGIGGIAYDNSHTPIPGMTVNANPPLIAQLPIDTEGTYGAYIGDESSSYTVNWEKSGYGTLPVTTFPPDADAQVDVVLPPANNIIANWGFEEGFSNWNIAGDSTPVITDSTKHSGSQSAFLGQPNPGFASPYRLSNSNGYVGDFKTVIDSRNNTHVLWSETLGIQGPLHIQYAWRSEQGVWSDIETLSSNGSEIFALLIDNNDTLHTAWANNLGQRVYAQRPKNGNWTTPEYFTITGNTLGSEVKIAVDQNGIVHAFIASNTTGNYYFDYFYRQRSINGVWSVPRLVAETYGPSYNLKLVVDVNDTLHAIWDDSDSDAVNDVLYVQRSSAGQWSTVQNLADALGESANLGDYLIDKDGVVHVVIEDLNIPYYMQRQIDGTWLNLEVPFDYAKGTYLYLAENGVIHMIWYDENQHVNYAQRYKDGNWTDPQAISLGVESSTLLQMIVDPGGYAHVVWGGLEPYLSNIDVYYTHQLGEDAWSVPLNLSSSTGTGERPIMVVDSGGYVQALWNDTGSGNGDLFYASPLLVNVAGESAVSQGFTIPVTTTTPTLSFMYRSGGIYSAEGSHVSVMIDDGTTTELPVIAASQGSWTHYSADLSEWIGEAVTLTLQLEQEASAPAAWAIIDEVTVGSTYSDNWVSIDDGNAAPGQEVIQTITYSNRGGAVASGVMLTYTLPAEMTYLSASVPPASTNPLVWHLPDLPAKSDPFEILVTARVNANTPPFTTLTSTAVITTDDTELELLNNQAEGHIYTAVRLYLPAIFR